MYTFDFTPEKKSIIKVVGVGGGGSNAVNYMYQCGIHGVDFLVVNTDAQSLNASSVPTRLQIGTEGLGVGNDPEKGRTLALNDKDKIREALEGCKMVFITAGMGGGTGTGAAPVVAQIAKDMGILTVGIVTVPFSFEGSKKRELAERGIAGFKDYCDTVIIILNERIREIYGSLSLKQAFSKADDVLAAASKSIAELITCPGEINVDFEDVNTVLRAAGSAVMGSATASGQDRAVKASQEALQSPLLNNTDIKGAQKILVSIKVSDMDNLSMDEFGYINDFFQTQADGSAMLKCGVAIDPTLEDKIAVTVVATGFTDATPSLTSNGPAQATTQPAVSAPAVSQPAFNSAPVQESAPAQHPTYTSPVQAPIPFEEKTPLKAQPGQTIELFSNPAVEPAPPTWVRQEEPKIIEAPVGVFPQPKEVHLQGREGYTQVTPAHSEPGFTVRNEPPAPYSQPQEKVIDWQDSTRDPQVRARMDQELNKRTERIYNPVNQNSFNSMDPSHFREIMEVPAYIRAQMKLKELPHSSEKEISRLNMNENNEIVGNNRFLHDNVD